MCRWRDMPNVFDAADEGGRAASASSLFGTYAMNSLRMEKSYRGWGSELTNEIDMFEGLDGALHPPRQAGLHRQGGDPAFEAAGRRA